MAEEDRGVGRWKLDDGSKKKNDDIKTKPMKKFIGFCFGIVYLLFIVRVVLHKLATLVMRWILNFTIVHQAFKIVN